MNQLYIPRISPYSDNPLLSLVGHTKRGRGRRAAGYPAPNFWLQGGGGEGSYFSLERNSFWGIPEHHTRHKQTIFYIESNQIFDLQFFSECLSTLATDQLVKIFSTFVTILPSYSDFKFDKIYSPGYQLLGRLTCRQVPEYQTLGRLNHRGIQRSRGVMFWRIFYFWGLIPRGVRFCTYIKLY